MYIEDIIPSNKMRSWLCNVRCVTKELKRSSHGNFKLLFSILEEGLRRTSKYFRTDGARVES
jgi:hypothetical protein